MRPVLKAVVLRFGTELRNRWRSWVALSLLVGGAGGVVVAAAAAARRTETAFPRLLRASRAADVLVVPSNPGPAYYDDLRRLPEVVGFGEEALPNVALVTPSGEPDMNVVALASVGGAFGTSISRPRIIRGRPLRPDAPDEVMIDRALADRLHLRPGSRFDTLGVPNDPQGTPDLSGAIPLRLRVAAVVVFTNQVVPINRNDSVPQLLLTPAFVRAWGTALGSTSGGGLVRLRPGTSLGAFRGRAEEVLRRHPEAGESLYVANLDDQAAKVEGAIRPQAVALWVFALLTGLIALAVVGQVLSRQVTLEAAEYPILSSLGMDRRGLAALSLLRVGAIALLGAVVATVIAVVASPLAPIGPARLAEVHPGLAVNLGVLGAGFLAVAVLPVVAGLPSVWRTAGAAGRTMGAAARGRDGRPSRVGAVVKGLGLPVAAAVGVRMALERNRRSVPVRSAVLGTTVALSAMASALVFGTSLDRLVQTPRLYGQTWDLALDAGFGVVPVTSVAPLLDADDDVIAYSGGNHGEVGVGGRSVGAVGIDPIRGTVFPGLLEGRPPANADEIVLGTRTLRRIHASVGDTAQVQLQDRESTMRIVGRAVFPNFGHGQFTPTGLGDGVAVVASTLPAIPSDAPLPPGPAYNFVLVRFRPGIDTQAARSRLLNVVRPAVCPPATMGCVITRQRPTDVGSYDRLRTTPLVLAAGLGVLALATLGHVLITAIHRRRRDLAVLKTLGFTRGQVSTTILWHSTVLATVAIMFGLPVGVAAGRWAWATFASSVGVTTGATVSVATVLLAAPLTLVAANLIGAGPGWVAGRLRPAAVLRTE